MKTKETIDTKAHLVSHISGRTGEGANDTVGAAKRPFDVEVAFDRLSVTMREYPKAGMFQLADLGYGGVFEMLVACILSIRTLDEVSVPAAQRLLDAARTPERMAALTPEEIDALIDPCVFHTPKSRTIHALAAKVAADYGGKLPCDERALLDIPGVGPKCASLALGIGCGKPLISVDIHVHRVVNRWGIVATNAPEETMLELEKLIQKSQWIDTNRLLMPFGKFICTGKLPHCSTCPLLDMCQQVGVTAHR
jgi:endonuclease-3